MSVEIKLVRTKDLISPYLSLKLKILSLLAVFLVVFHHAYNLDIGPAREVVSPLNFGIQHFLSQGGFASVAVPFFFLISGILFFFNFTSFSYQWYLEKLKKRFRTLFIPYLLWSLFSILIFFILQSLPVTQNFFRTKIVDHSFYELLVLFFLKPPAYQLWFIRDLLVLIIFSPILVVISKFGDFFNITALVVLLLLWLLQVDLIFISVSSVLFFFMGAYLIMKKRDLLNKKCLTLFNVAFFLWVILVILKIFLQYFSKSSHLIGIAIILLGVLSLWIGYDKFYEKISFFIIKYKMLLGLSPFFIYLAHEPLLSLIKNFLLNLFYYSDIARVFTYFTAPILTLAFLFWVNKILVNSHLNFFNLITGERK